MPQIDGYSLALPVLAGELFSDGVSIKCLVGTAFNIGRGYYITAGHVIQQASEYDIVALGVAEGGIPWRASRVSAWEINEEFDIAVFCSEHEISNAFPWETAKVSNLTDIVICGYPHGLYIKEASIYRRDFKGYIITNRPYSILTGKPTVYELSIPCPRGSSGAFVLNDKSGKICGIVIGSDKSEIDLNYEVEGSSEVYEKVIHHKTETSTYGIAVASMELLNLEFKILNGSLQSFLKSNNLID